MEDLPQQTMTQQQASNYLRQQLETKSFKRSVEGYIEPLREKNNGKVSS